MPKRIAERVLERFLVAAMTDERLNELLLRLYKGATGSLNWSQLAAVFEALEGDWKLEKTVEFVKLYGIASKPNAPESFWDPDDKAFVDARHQETQRLVVNSLPVKPKAGQLYMLDLSPVSLGRHDKGWEFTVKPWIGHEGWRITSPTGKTFEVMPDRYGVSGSFFHGYKPRTRAKLSLSDAVEWLNKETNWRQLIDKKLGLEAFEPSAPRSRDGTGTCPACFQNVKARPEIALHGYKRPGTGQVIGNCFGTGFPPFEMSVKGVKAYLDERLKPAHKEIVRYIEQLGRGEIKQITTRRGQHVTPADDSWEEALSIERERAYDRENFRKARIEAYEDLVKYWKERPLPKEGEPLIDWFKLGQKP